MAQYLNLPNGTSIKFPDGTDYETAMRKAREQFPQEFGIEDDAPQPKGGFKAAFGSSMRGLEGALELGKAGLGIKSNEEAEAARALIDQEDKRKYKPESKGFAETPWAATKELFGSSLPYVAAPLIAGGAATVLGAPALAATGLGGLASAAQFTLTNADRQVDEKTKIADIDWKSAGAAAIPQAALDMIGFKMMPGIRQIMQLAGKEVTEEAAKRIATQGVKQIAADYAKTTGKAMGAEGITEAAQQVLERMQAGLNLTDEKARDEYFQSLIGGAVLGGALSPAGRFVERSGERTQQENKIKLDEQKTQQAAADELAAQRATPEYIKDLAERFAKHGPKLAELQAAAEAKYDKNDMMATAAHKEAVAALNEYRNSDEVRDLRTEVEQNRGSIEAAEKHAAEEKAARDAEAAQAEASRPLNDLLQAQNALERQIATAKNAGIAAMQSGDIEAARTHQATVAELTPQATALQEQIATRRSAEVDVGSLAKLQKMYANAMRSGDTKKAGALLDNIAAIYGEKAKQDAAQEAVRQSLVTPQGAVPGNQAAGEGPFVTLPEVPTAATTAAPAVSKEANERLRDVFGAAAEDDAKSRDLYRTPTAAVRAPGSTTNNTLALKQDALFGDLEPGGTDPRVGKASQLLAQIEQLQNRPNTPDATQRALDNYAKALSHPEMDNADNAGAQAALERIAENINKIAYQGYGQGEARNLTRAEVNARVAAVDAKLNAWRPDTQAIAQARAALRDAPFEEQAARKHELDALLRPTALLAERNRLRTSGLDVRLTPYERQQKQLTTIGEDTAIAGEATDKQVENAKMVQPKGEATRRPSALGREVVGVNAAPDTVQEQSSFFGAVDETGEQASVERVAPPSATITPRGMARVERGAERGVGMTRALPDDTEVTSAMQALSPADKKTLGLWDNVFGEGSAANRLVRDAEAGLTKAQNAVDVASRELTGLKAALEKALLPIKAVTGDVMPTKRGADTGAAHATAMEQHAATVKADADAKFNAAQADVQRIGQSVVAATERLKRAKAALDAEMSRLKASGELSSDFLQFIGGSDLAAELSKAATQVADVLKRSKSANAAAVDALLGEQGALIPHIKSAVTAQQIIQDVVPQVRKLMGPRVATLVETLLRVRAAHNIMGAAQELDGVVKQAEATVAEQTGAREKAIKAAQKQMAAGDKAVTAATVKAEIARAEADAKQKGYQALLDKITTFTATDPVAKAANTAVESKVSEIEQLQKTALDRVTKARTDVERAKETRKLVLENEAAMRSGKASPLMADIATNIKNIEAIYNRTEASLRGMWEAPADARAALTEGITDYENQLEGLRRTEASLATLWEKHADDTVHMEDVAATLIDAAALLTPTEYDTQMHDANRALDTAELVGGARAAAAEEAALMTELDAALKPLRERLKENTELLESPQSDAHRKALNDHRGRITKQMNETAELYRERLVEARSTKERMGEESRMSPDPDSKGWAFEQMLNLKARREAVQSQLDAIAAAITSIRAERTELVAAERKKHDDVMKTAKALGAATDDVRHAATRAKLSEMLNDQRVLEARADKEIAEAEGLVNEAIARVKEEGYTNLDAMQDYRAARKIYDEAVGARARVYDHSLQMMRDQLELAKSLPAAAPAKPTPQTAFFNSKAPEAAARPEAIKATADTLREGDISGPEATQTEEAQRAFEERVNTTDDPRALRKERGGYEGDIAAIEDKLAALTDKPDMQHPVVKLLQKNLAEAEAKLNKLYKPTTFDSSLPKADLEKAITNVQERVKLARTQLENGIKGLTKKSATLRQRSHMSPEASAQIRVDIQRRMAEAQRKLNAAEAARDAHAGLTPPRITKAIANAKEELTFARDDLKNMDKSRGKNDSIRAGLLEQKLALQEKVTTITDRLSRMERGQSVATIAGTQGPAVRRGVATKKALNAGDMLSGDTTKIEGRLQADGTRSADSTVAKESMVGTRNKIAERAIHPTTTAERAAAQAAEDTAEGTQLREDMTAAAYDRRLNDAIAERAAAKESNDAVQKSKAGAPAKAAAKARLEAAIKAVKAVSAEGAVLGETAATSDVNRIGKGVGDEIEEGSARDYTTEGTASHAAVSDAIYNNDTIGVVDALIKHAATPELRALAAKLRPFVSAVRIGINPDLTYNGKEVPGLYTHTDNRVQIHADGITDETVLHELLHAATMQVLEQPKSQLTPAQHAAVAELSRLYESIKHNPTFAKDYGATDLKEFIAELYVDPQLRAKLDAIGKPQTLMQRIWNAIKRALGVGTDPESTKALAAIDRIMAESGRGSASAAPRATAVTSNALDALSDKVIAKPKTMRERMGNFFALETEMQLVDMRAGIREALKTGDHKNYTQAMSDLVLADQKSTMASAALTRGYLVNFKDEKGYHGTHSSGKVSGKDVFEAIADVPGKDATQRANRASIYMIAQRAANKGLSKLDLKTLGVTQSDVTAAMAAANADPVLKKSLEKVRSVYNEYNAGMVHWLADTGAIPKKLAQDLLADGDYVPYYRVSSNGTAELHFGNEMTITIGDVRHQPYLQALKGGEEKILPLTESLQQNTLLLVDKGLTNQAQKSIAYALQAIGRDAKGGRLMKIHAGKSPADPGVIRFNQEPDPSNANDDGGRWIKVQTDGTIMDGIPAELVVKSIEGAHLMLPSFLKLGAAAADLLRSGITRTPLYIARQLVRDPMASTFTSGINYSPLKAVLKAGMKFIDMNRKDSATEAVLIEKGLVHSGIFQGDYTDMKKQALQLASGKDQTALNRLFAALDRGAMRADGATRALVYENAIGNGMSEVEASMMVRESMNFSKRGLSQTVQHAARLIPFFNAQIQALNVLAKAARGNMPFEEQQDIKRKFFNNAMLLAGTGMAYAMAMQDDDYYKNARPRDRYTNFFVPMPGGGEPIKIPIPYEVGYFFSVAVAAVDAMMSEVDTKAQAKALGGMFLNSVPGLSSAGVPQLVKPLAEVATGTNFFTWQSVEPERLKGLDPDKRYVATTTELAKRMSELVPGLSPIQIEHITKGYLGIIPLAIAAATNEVFATTPMAERASPNASDTPLVGSAFQKRYGGGDADVVYDLANDAVQAKRTLDRMQKAGQVEEARQYREDNKARLAAAAAGSKFKDDIGKLNADIERIKSHPTMDAQTKREHLDMREQTKETLAKEYLKIIKRIEASAA